MLFFKRKNSFKQLFKRFFGPIERLENREQPGSLFGVDAMFSPMITSLLDVPTEPISDTTIVNSPVAQPEFLDTSLEAQNSTQAASSITEFTIISDTSTVSSDAQVDAGFTTLSNETGTGVDVSADPFSAIFAASVFGGNTLSGVSVSSLMDVNSGTTGNVVTPISDLDGLTLPTLNIAGLDGAPESSADSLFAAINGAGLVAGMDNASTPILDGGSSSGGDGAGNQGSSTVTINFPTPVLNPLNPIIEMNPLMPLPPGAGDLVGVNIAGIGQNPVAPANPVQNNNNPVVNNQANPVNPDVQLDGGIGNGGALLGVGLLGSDSNGGDYSYGNYGMGGVGVGLPSQNVANGVLPNGAVDPQVIAGAVGAGQIAAAANAINQFIIPGAGPIGSNLYNPPANASTALSTQVNGTETMITTVSPGQVPPEFINAPLGVQYDRVSPEVEVGPTFDPANGSTLLQSIHAGAIPIAYTYQEHDRFVTPTNDGNDLPIYPGPNFPIAYNQISRLDGTLVSLIDRDYVKFTLTQPAGVFIQMDTQTIPGGMTDPQMVLYSAVPFSGTNTDDPSDVTPTILDTADDSYIIADMNSAGSMIVNYPIPTTGTIGVHSLTGAYRSQVIADTPVFAPLTGATGLTNAGANQVANRDPMIYRDLQPGVYFVEISGGFNSRTLENQSIGNWRLDFFADTGYMNTPPVFQSNPSATNNLVLDFTGDASLNLAAYDIGGSANVSPIEQIAMNNIFNIVHEDFSPFDVNVTTNASAFRANSKDFRVVITSSDIAGTVSFDGYATRDGYIPAGSTNGAGRIGGDLGYVPNDNGVITGVVSQARFAQYFGRGFNPTGASTRPSNNLPIPPITYDVGYGSSYSSDAYPLGQGNNWAGGYSSDATATALEIGNSISNIAGFFAGARNIGYDLDNGFLGATFGDSSFFTSDYTLGLLSLVDNGQARFAYWRTRDNAPSPVSNLQYINDGPNPNLITFIPNGIFPGNADDRIMSNAPEIDSQFNQTPVLPTFNVIGRFSDAGFSREIWDDDDYQPLVNAFGARPEDGNGSPLTAKQMFQPPGDVNIFYEEGVISSNSDKDWFKFNASRLVRIEVDVDEFAGNLEPVFEIWAFDPQFYRPQRITGYNTFTIRGGTFEIDFIVSLPQERDYYINLGNPYSLGATVGSVTNNLLAGHYRLTVTKLAQ